MLYWTLTPNFDQYYEFGNQFKIMLILKCYYKKKPSCVRYMIRWHWGNLPFSSKLTKNCNRQVLKVMQGLLILFSFNNAQLSIIAGSGEQSKSLVLQPPLHCRLKNIEKSNMLPSPKYLSLWSNFFPRIHSAKPF